MVVCPHFVNWHWMHIKMEPYIVWCGAEENKFHDYLQKPSYTCMSLKDTKSTKFDLQSFKIPYANAFNPVEISVWKSMYGKAKPNGMSSWLVEVIYWTAIHSTQYLLYTYMHVHERRTCPFWQPTATQCHKKIITLGYKRCSGISGCDARWYCCSLNWLVTHTYQYMGLVSHRVVCCESDARSSCHFEFHEADSWIAWLFQYSVYTCNQWNHYRKF